MNTDSSRDDSKTSELDSQQAPGEVEQSDEALAEISALLDDQKVSQHLLASIDRIAGDDSARRYYLRARALEGLIDSLESPPRQEPPASVWSRIAAEAEVEVGPMGWGRAPVRLPIPRASHPVRTWLAAAVLVVLSVLAGAWWQQRSSDRESAFDSGAQLAQIEIGARSGEMTPNRFVDLAAEILEADRSYRRELLGLMVTIEREMAGEEISLEPSAGSDFDDRRGEEGRGSGDFGELDTRRRDGVSINVF